jgi:hypothetical protein
MRHHFFSEAHVVISSLFGKKWDSLITSFHLFQAIK